MSLRCVTRVVSMVSLALFTVLGSGLMALPASAVAGTTTLHFYSVEQTYAATDAAGQPFTTNATLPVGAHYDTTDLNYVGNHKHHAASFSASDHIACTVTSPTAQTCNLQIAIGGSLLLGNNVTLTFSTPTPTATTTASAQINAGTGKYKNTRGMFENGAGNPNNVDVTITLTG